VIKLNFHQWATNFRDEEWSTVLKFLRRTTWSHFKFFAGLFATKFKYQLNPCRTYFFQKSRNCSHNNSFAKVVWWETSRFTEINWKMLISQTGIHFPKTHFQFSRFYHTFLLQDTVLTYLTQNPKNRIPTHIYCIQQLTNVRISHKTCSYAYQNILVKINLSKRKIRFMKLVSLESKK
jgi:hypothetical protein